jgi:site-specific DNA-methyltransferase (adenine-specific)
MSDPYYSDEVVTLYHGDAMEILPTLKAGAFHLAATDPPYFRVIDAEWDDQWGPDHSEFLRWIGEVVGMLDGLLHDRGTLAVFCSPDMSAGVELEVRRRMAVLNHVVWRKPGPGRLGMIEKEKMRRFFPTSERIIIAEKSRNPDGDLFRFTDHVWHSVARETYADLITRLVELRDAAGLTNRQIDAALGRNGMASHYFGRSQWALPTEEAWTTIATMMSGCGVEPPPYAELRQEFDSRRREFDSRRREFELLSDVWTFDPVPASSRHASHPTQKPIALMEHLVATMSRRNDVILDPFAGTGTTLRVAKDLGRHAVGIEMDERYCEAAARRLSQESLGLEIA